MSISRTVCVAILVCSQLAAICQSKDSLEVVRATRKFINAFNNLDWQPFKNAFSKDATVFYPELQYGKRVAGQKDMENTWLEIFPEFKDPTNKLKMNIVPEDVLVQLYKHTAVVTFQMGKLTNFLSRRTLVFIKEKQGWKIAHLHASNVSAN